MSFSVRFRGRFETHLRSQKWPNIGPKRDPKGARSASDTFSKNVETPKVFQGFFAPDPFEDGFQTGFLETSLPTCI